MIKLALIQAELAWEDVTANLNNFEKKIQNVDADIIILPEMFSSGFTMKGKEKIAPFYEVIKEKMKSWAEKSDALIMGSTIFEERGFFYNRLLAVFPKGEILHYDKRHCFTMGEEHEHFTPGKEKLIFNYKGIKIAPFICYDLRFPVWSRNLEDYDLAVYVANWPESRRMPWMALLIARAIENQCYVAGVNCVGVDGNGLKYSGDSIVVSPRGEVLLEFENGKEEVKIVTIDLDTLYDFREKFPVLKDRDDFIIK